MKDRLLVFILICGLCGGVYLGAAETPANVSGSPLNQLSVQGSTQESDGVVARVNDEIITQRELDKTAGLLNTHDKDMVLKNLIRERLLYQAALKAEIKIPDNEVNDVLNKYITQYGSQKTFEEKVLAPLKISFAEYQDDVKRQLLRERFIMNKMSSSVLEGSQKVDFFIDTFVTPKEIKAFYEAHQKEFAEPEQVKTRQIILKTRDGAEAFAKKSLAEAILAELKKNGDFEALARKYSEIKAESGGDWDWVPKGSFPKEVEEIIYQLNEGEISPVIETETNLRIIKVEKRKGGIHNDFANPIIQENIRRFLMNQKITGGAEKLIKELARSAQLWPLGLVVYQETPKTK